MVKKFKKPSGYVVVYDSKVHSKQYLADLKSKFEEVKPAPPPPPIKKKPPQFK